MGDHDMDAEYPDHEATSVERLWLSLLGGWFTGWGSFSGSGLVAAWGQRIAGGRDVHAQITRRRWLAPFGHAAGVIVTTDRTFLVDTAGGITAALQQREFLSVAPSTLDTAASWTPCRMPVGNSRSPPST